MNFNMFTAKIWDEISSQPEEVCGLVLGNSLSEIAETLDHEFGKDLISVTIEPWSIKNVLLMSKETLTLVSEEEY